MNPVQIAAKATAAVVQKQNLGELISEDEYAGLLALVRAADRYVDMFMSQLMRKPVYCRIFVAGTEGTIVVLVSNVPRCLYDQDRGAVMPMSDMEEDERYPNFLSILKNRVDPDVPTTVVMTRSLISCTFNVSM
jgi:hypothetical protein